MSCYTGFFNVRRGWQSLNTGPGFIYVSSAGRVGCEFLHPAQPTDAPSSRRSSRSHFYTPGFPIKNRTFTTAVQVHDEQYDKGFSECIAINVQQKQVS
jgi:hypothetical protein